MSNVIYDKILDELRQKDQGEPGTTPHIDSTTKHWMIGETDTGIVAEGKDGDDGITPHIGANGHWWIGNTDTGVKAELSGSYLTFSSVTNNTVTFAGTTTVPFAVLTNAGHFYPIEKGSLTVDTVNNTCTVDVTPYLAYDNVQTFSGTWRVYFSAGSSDPGDDIATLTGAAVTPKHGAVYVHTLAADDAFTIDSTGLSANKQVTFELHLVQPSTAVSFTLPNTLLWADSFGDFASENPPPAMSTADTLYCIVIRWDGSDLLANLAYKKAVEVPA